MYSPALDRDRSERVRVDVWVVMDTSLMSGPIQWMVGKPVTPTEHTRVYVSPSAGVPLTVILTV